MCALSFVVLYIVVASVGLLYFILCVFCVALVCFDLMYVAMFGYIIIHISCH